MNNEIEIKIENNEMLVSSRQIAEHFGKRHDKLVSEIERMYTDLTNEGCVQNGGDPLFYKTTYTHEQNKQSYPMYLMNRDGFSLLVMGFTGKEALEWKLKYIQAFNDMETKLKQSKSVEDSRADKLLLAQSKAMNAKARLASVWLKLADRVPNNQTYQQICNSYASEVLTGAKVLPLPECDERYYTATEIAEMVGSTANMVGRRAKAAGIKPADENTYSEYGKWFFDKSAHSSKQVSTFKYNARGVEAVKTLFNQAAVLA